MENSFGCFVLLTLHFISDLHAQETDKIIPNDTLIKIAQRNLHRVRTSHGSDFKSYAEDIEKWNPFVKNWNHPPKDQLIYVTYPYNAHAAGVTWAPALGKEIEQTPAEKTKKLTFFYSTALGNYKEEGTTQIVESKQYIPTALGLTSGLDFIDRNHSLLSGLYWSKAAEGDFNGSTFSIPGEISAHIHYKYDSSSNVVGFFTGLDYEKLSTFKTTDTSNGTVAYYDNHLYYLSLGLIKNFSLSRYSFGTSLSVSQSLTSSSTAPRPLKGIQYNFSFILFPIDRFSFEIFYKRHELKSNQKFIIDRTGLSIGLTLF